MVSDFPGVAGGLARRFFRYGPNQRRASSPATRVVLDRIIWPVSQREFWKNMSWIDWSIMAVPMVIVCFIAYRTNAYMKGVSDFLSAGRVAGRYLVCTAAGMAGMGVISVVGAFEQRSVAGFSSLWWGMLGFPVGVIVSISGFVIYRYRETRALTLAQFFEMRYSRNFRIYAGILGAVSGILNYGIFPAIGGPLLRLLLRPARDLPSSR